MKTPKPSFKTNPEGAKLLHQENFISNEKSAQSTTNQSEYSSKRIFENENLPRNKVYYYCNNINIDIDINMKLATQHNQEGLMAHISEEMARNKNIIFK